MSDGAHFGYEPIDALKAVIGNEDPPDSPPKNPAEMQVWLLASTGPPFDSNGDGYNQCARYAAKLVLEQFLASPGLATVDEDHLYNVLRVKLVDLGMTGFQWGWAMNAARYCVELPPVANPAIITVKSDDDASTT